jgi:hypothetical protein
MEKEHLEMILEDINGKFDLLLEGHAGLQEMILAQGLKTDERFDLIDFKIDTLNKKIDGVDENLSKKIDGVAAELRAHRADTEAHRGVYGVRED